jgi:hypothetical protein
VESWDFGQAVRRWHDRAAPEAAGVPAGGRRITVYTAEPGTEDAERLALAVVLGTQALVGQGLRKWTDR